MNHFFFLFPFSYSHVRSVSKVNASNGEHKKSHTTIISVNHDFFRRWTSAFDSPHSEAKKKILGAQCSTMVRGMISGRNNNGSSSSISSSSSSNNEWQAIEMVAFRLLLMHVYGSVMSRNWLTITYHSINVPLNLLRIHVDSFNWRAWILLMIDGFSHAQRTQTRTGKNIDDLFLLSSKLGCYYVVPPHSCNSCRPFCSSSSAFSHANKWIRVEKLCPIARETVKKNTSMLQ